MNFLIVDDNPELNRFLTTIFHRKGHVLGSLTDPTEAVQWLQDNPCDGVIMDICMPKTDGIILTAMIRQEHQDLPIVIFTGYGYDEDRMQASRQAGANGYVSKGLGLSEIYSALMRVIAQKSNQPTPAPSPLQE